MLLRNLIYIGLTGARKLAIVAAFKKACCYADTAGRDVGQAGERAGTVYLAGTSVESGNDRLNES
jgi:ATP-dependent exoDNAse (exonuclease V) alpha subunit